MSNVKDKKYIKIFVFLLYNFFCLNCDQYQHFKLYSWLFQTMKPISLQLWKKYYCFSNATEIPICIFNRWHLSELPGRRSTVSSCAQSRQVWQFVVAFSTWQVSRNLGLTGRLLGVASAKTLEHFKPRIIFSFSLSSSEILEYCDFWFNLLRTFLPNLWFFSKLS